MAENRIRSANALAGKSQIASNLSWCISKEIGGAHIRKKADTHLRHGKDRAVRNDAVFSMYGDSKTTSHNNAVHKDDVRLWIVGNQIIESILLKKERLNRGDVAGSDVVVKCTN